MFNFPEFKSNKNFYCIIILVFSCFFYYLPILDVGFISDDWKWLEFAQKFSLFNRPEGWFFRPLNEFIFFIFFKLFGLNYFYYHLISILFHIIAVICFYLFLTSLFLSCREYNGFEIEIAFLSSFIWAILFINSQALIWIVASFDYPVCLIFFILTLHFYLKYSNYKKKRFYYLAIYFFILCMFCREIFIFIPCLLFFLDFLLFKQNIFSIFKKLIPFILLTFLYLLIYLHFIYPHLHYYQPAILKTTLAVNFLKGLGKMFTNIILSLGGIVRADNFYKLLNSFPTLNFLAGVLQKYFLINLLFIFIFFLSSPQKFNLRTIFFKYKKYFAFCLIWFAVMSFMFIIWGKEGSGDNISFPLSRYYYLPSTAVCIIIAIFYLSLWQSKNKLLHFVLVNLLLIYTSINFINFYTTTRGYKSSAENTLGFFKKIEEPIMNFSEKNYLYLVDFPQGYYVYYNYYLNSYFKVVHNTEPEIFWVSKINLQKINFANCQKNNCYFLLFYNKYIINITDFMYKKLK